MYQFIFTRDSVANTKASAILDRNPGMQQSGNFDDGEEKQEHNRQDKRKLDKCLPFGF
jgi:hypothetical protein